MKRYTLFSGIFFALIALLQLTRVVLQWKVNVAGVDVPLWASIVAFLLAGSFAIWALRVQSSGAE